MDKNFNRREFIKTTGLGALSITLPGFWSCGKKPERKPNVIFILADDLGYGDIGCNGQEKIKTPNIDKLAAGGKRFTQHYAGSTVCAPSRCSLMTGRHTGHTFIRGNRPKNGYQFEIPQDSFTVGDVFKQAGYSTGAVGKWGLGGPGTSGDPNKQGFDYFFGYLGQVQAHFYYPDHLWENEKKVYLEEGTFSHDLMTEKALKFIETNKEKPFFLYLPYTIPHAELKVPDDSLEQYKGKFPEKPYAGRHYGSQETPRAAYAAMVSRMDADVGRVTALLEQLGLDKETLVIFSSDNGPHKEGGIDPEFFKSSGPFRGIKRDLYEGGICIPMVTYWPGRINPGTESSHVSAFWDFLPTACDITGTVPPAGCDGISYLPELLGKDQKKHDYLYWEFHEQGGKQAVRMGNWKGVRLKVKKNPNGPVELYNLKNDIREKNNVAAENAEIVKNIREIMNSARTESKEFPFIKSKQN